MMTEMSWVVFGLTSLMLVLTPGQDMILVMSRSVSQGVRAGVATAAGVSLGLVGHTVLAALGLGALLQTSELLFSALKLVGAGYLVYLGVGLIRTRPGPLGFEGLPPRSTTRLFFDGAFSNLANPKIAIFYFAFLPQFVTPAASNPTMSILILGLLYAMLAFLVKAPIGLSAGMLSRWLRARPGRLTWLYRSSGTVLVGLGLKLAFEPRG